MEPRPTTLPNSTRSLRKVTHVPLKIVENGSERGRAVVKQSFVRQLALQKGDVDRVLEHRTRAKSHVTKPTRDSNYWNTLRRLEGTTLTTSLPPASDFADLSTSELLSFGRSLVKVRQDRLDNAQKSNTSDQNDDTRTDKLEPIWAAVVSASAEPLKDIAVLTNLLNSAVAATNAFNANTSISPVGMLNLERMEMVPAGLEKGELLSTIPLAPKEKTSVVQQEWSVIDQEFSTIVTDSLENFSKTGVAENNELAQATASQNSHSNQFNITASASGGCGFASGSMSTSFSTQGADSSSANVSRKHAEATTKEASCRTIKSKKVTISTSSVSGSSTATTRTLENPSDNQAMRIDYFSMMRKWHVGLYRYGLRLTYDITIPEPGAAMRMAYKELDCLNRELQKQFIPPIKIEDIKEGNYQGLCTKYGAQIPAAPLLPEYTSMSVGGPFQNHGTDGTGDLFTNQTTINVPEGYEITFVTLMLIIGYSGPRRVDILGSLTKPWLMAGTNDRDTFQLKGLNGLDFLSGRTGTQVITHVNGGFRDGTFEFYVGLKRTDQNFHDWEATVYNAIYEAAQTTYYAKQAKLQARIAAIKERISGIDTLTLRREENDEIMKCVLRWILGTNFEFVPDKVVDLFTRAATGPDGTQTGDLQYGVNFTGNSIDPERSAQDWAIMYRYEAMVSFINQAIEWENVVYFLYSYFWDIPRSWEFVRNIQHPDATRQAFLRAGAARVVLTVRKGYEAAFTWFAEEGDLVMPPQIPNGHPYMTLAQQVQNYDNTNYPGIPPANPGRGVPDEVPQAATMSTATLAPSKGPVAIQVADSAGFVVGAQAVIDNWDASMSEDNPTGIQECRAIMAVPNSTRIVVQGLQFAHGGVEEEYPIFQAAPKGLLIAEWSEYTPSSGTMIAVNSDLKSIA